MENSKKKPALIGQRKKIEGKGVQSNGFERKAWIEESAYYKAEARGFSPGHEEQDWNLAEKEYAHCVAIE